jgi:peptidoglycan/xylan/chitin deacetylase (PgdA/CDA1 family)
MAEMARGSLGSDHDIHPYSPQPMRPEWRLPGGAKLAVVILLMVEAREITPPPDAWRDPRFRNEFGSFEPDWRSWTTREYGSRVGAYRLLDSLDRHGLAATAPVNLLAARRHPELLAALMAQGIEIAAHGIAETRMITSRMAEAEERAHILESRDGLASLTGAPAEGWLGQDAGGTPRTARLLAEAGFRYSLDWANDEEPYLHAVPGGLVAVPHPMDLDDAQLLFLRRVPVQRWPGLVAEAMDALLAEPRGGRVLTLGLHPWLAGQPQRIRYARDVLAEVARRRGDVLVTTAATIARAFRAQAG